MQTTFHSNGLTLTFKNIGDMLKWFGTPIRELALQKTGEHRYNLTRNGMFLGEVIQ